MEDETNFGRGWVISWVTCDLCGYKYLDVRPAGLDSLECPDCHNFNEYYETEGIETEEKT